MRHLPSDDANVSLSSSRVGIRLLVALSGFAIFSFTSPFAGATVYSIDAPPGVPISGTITTDGLTGTLSSANITSWQITQSADTTHYVSSITPANSVVNLSGAGLTASATQLFFDFSGSGGSLLTFTSNSIMSNGGLSLQYCDAASPCLNQNNAPIYSSTIMVFVAPGCCSTSGGAAQTGINEIAAIAPTVPEPGSWVMMIAGLAVVGSIARARRDRTRAPASA